MQSSSVIVFKIFSLIAGIINPIITILIGVLLTRIEDVLYTINPIPGNQPPLPRKQKTIKLIKLIGALMILGGGLKCLDNIINLIRYFFGFLARMY
jgi:hypothetical protein